MRDGQRLGKQQNMWLSTPGGKDYLKCHFGGHTESPESAWLPGSQALSSLPLCLSPKHGKWHFGAKKVLGYLQKCLAKIHLMLPVNCKNCTDNGTLLCTHHSHLLCGSSSLQRKRLEERKKIQDEDYR